MGVLTLLSEYAKPFAFVLAMALCTFGGWKMNTWYTGNQRSLSLDIEKQVDNALDRMQQGNAKTLIDTNKLIKDNAKVIEKPVPFIVEREVYKNVCIDEDGNTVLLDLKRNSIETRKKLQ